MSVSADQYQALLTRITRLEQAVNDLMTAINQVTTPSQLNQIFALISTDLDDVKVTVASLATRVETIENEPIS
jgi:hypothetical protein